MDTKQKSTFSIDNDSPFPGHNVSMNESNCKQILRALNEQRAASFRSEDQDNALCDAILIVQGSRFPVHRCILAASSVYFRTMFCGKRFLEGHVSEINLQGVSREVITILIDVLYGSSLRLDTDTVYDILAAADLFLMDTIRHLCIDFLLLVLKSPISRRETLNIWKVGEMFSIEELTKSAYEIMQVDFDSVCQSEAFIELTYNELNRILTSSNITCDEYLMFEAVISWIKTDIDNRLKYLDCVMKHVRFPLIDPEKLLLLVVKEELLMKSVTCVDFLDEAKQYMLLPKMQSFLQSPRTKPRFTEDSSLIYMLSGLQHFKCYVPYQRKWYSLQAPDPVERREEWEFPHTSLLCVNDDIYCAVSYGFHDEVGRYNLIQLQNFSISGNCWKQCSLPSACTNVTLVQTKGLLYGCTRNSLELYDPLTDSWSCLTNWDLDPYQVVVTDDQTFYFFNFVEGISQEIKLRDLKVNKHQFYMPNQFIVTVQTVVKLRSHQIFLVLRTLTGISGKIFNIRSNQWKNANLNIHRHHYLLPVCHDDLLYHVTCDRTDDHMFILFHSPLLPRTINEQEESPHDSVLPYFSVDMRNGMWTRLPCLPEYLNERQINLCIKDNRSSMAAVQ